MKIRMSVGQLVTAVGLCLILASCAGPQTQGKAQLIQELDLKKDKAEWVKRGSGSFSEDRGKVLHGVGSAAGYKNPSLMRTAAETKARGELAGVLETYVQALVELYVSETVGGSELDRSATEQHAMNVMSTVTDAVLRGSEITDHWDHPDRNESFALASLDLAALEQYLQTIEDFGMASKELNERVKERIIENAKKAHERLEHKIQEKREQQ